MVITFNTGLVVLAVLQLILALSLSNLVMRSDTPPIWVSSIIQTLAPWLCLSDLPLIGSIFDKMRMVQKVFSNRSGTSSCNPSLVGTGP